jgi:hypothetical protein
MHGNKLQDDATESQDATESNTEPQDSTRKEMAPDAVTVFQAKQYRSTMTGKWG